MYPTYMGSYMLTTLDAGLQRTDNNMEFTTWPQVPMINQKNYYTEFLKRDDQALAVRLQQEAHLNARKKAAVDIDRARAQAAHDGIPFAEADPDLDDDVVMDDVLGDNYGSKTIVIHVGSQNMRIGLATDALPKTIPMVIAKKADRSEAEDGEPRPKRIKLDASAPSEEWFGDEFAKEYNAMAQDYKVSRRANKRRVLPNSRELVTKWNSTTPPETIPEHSDPMRIDWTELPANPKAAPDCIVGAAALRIPEQSRPRYRLHWPIRHGWLNEKDYQNRSVLEGDFFLIIEQSIKTELEIPHKKDWTQYSCVFIVPDLYEKVMVGKVLEQLIRNFGFQRVCFLQESTAATFGAGFGTACIVDIGAQKTSISCVEDGMVMEESRINLKMGGYDVTETFAKMMLFDRFNYSDFNLMRRYDFLLAEELKERFTTMSDENVSVQLFDFHVRAFGQKTRKYSSKIYDEGTLTPMGYFRPAIFDHADKLDGRRSIIPRSVDLYNGHPNDPLSKAQMAVVLYVKDAIPSAVLAPPAQTTQPLSTTLIPTPNKPRPLPLPSHLNPDPENTPRSSPAASPAPDDPGTPHPPTADDTNPDDPPEPKSAAPDTALVDRTVPVMPLDTAILTSIHHATLPPTHSETERRRRDLLGGIILVGGGAKTPYLASFLETRLRAVMAQYPKEILVAMPPREMDPAVLVWKGGSIFGKLRMTNDSWIGGEEYDRLGSRILGYKCIWHW
ncbi:Actin-like protein arp8 [Friedmanniomyces endolithicus]|nr:Actin-like protein arp8 [Friedmanniomyces endolithicus]